MGMIPDSLAFLHRHVNTFSDRHILELGNQQMMCHGGIAEGSPAKAWFESLGAHHVSIDINGLLGALPLDLSKPIDQPDWVGRFHMVTDFGTSEHVGPDLAALYQCRRSCHRFCRRDGLMFFVNPITGHWPKHGIHYFTTEHYTKLATAQGYRICEINTAFCCGNFVDSKQVFALMRKENDDPFMPLDKYIEVCRGTVLTA